MENTTSTLGECVLVGTDERFPVRYEAAWLVEWAVDGVIYWMDSWKQLVEW